MSHESRKRGVARQMLRRQGHSLPQSIEIEKKIRNRYTNYGLGDYKFAPGIVRLTLASNFDEEVIGRLNSILPLIADETHIDEYTANFNDLSFDELYDRFGDLKKYNVEKEREESLKRKYERNDEYEIVPINSEEDAAKYSQYTSWCITTSSDMHDRYTHNGTGKFYFALKKGFEKEPRVAGEKAPLDKYGLSMIAVSVNMDGSANTITCRWNHDNRGNDSVMTPLELESLLGRSFYEAFPAKTREELHAIGKYLFDEIQDVIDDGADIDSVFDDTMPCNDSYCIVELYGKYNVLRKADKEILFDKWADSIEFSDGFLLVSRFGKSFVMKENTETKDFYTFVDIECDGLSNLAEGVVVVTKNRKQNYYDLNQSKYLMELDDTEWFDQCHRFVNEFGIVMLNSKYNYMTHQGKFLVN